LSDPLLVAADYPDGIVTPSVLSKLGGDPAIGKAARAAHNSLLGRLGGKFAITDASVAASPTYKWLLMRRTLVQLYLENEVNAASNQTTIVFYTSETDKEITQLLKENGVLAGVPLISASQAETLGATGFAIVSDRRVFGERCSSTDRRFW
jgi:hypothetical protein